MQIGWAHKNSAAAPLTAITGDIDRSSSISFNSKAVVVAATYAF
jgi:hypothetical protein